jgi:lipopolysaccharide heptosyltransferase I
LKSDLLRILIVRTSALGDIVHALPVLTALRRHLPSARIAWVVEEPYLPLLEGHPDLDEVLSVRLRTWRNRLLRPSTYHEIATFLERLQSFSADIAFDLMGNHKSAMITALSLADRRIGLTYQSRREPSSAFWLSEFVNPMKDHAVDRMLALLEALDVPPGPVDFGGSRLFRPPDATSLVNRLAQTESSVVIHPGTAWGNKCYPPDRWGQVATILGERLQVKTSVVASPGEENLARQVVEDAAGHASEVFAPDLHSLAELLRDAKLVLGGDTGPLHLAHALGTRVLCVMGPTDPARTGPYGSLDLALWRQLPCSFCYKRFDLAKACLLELPPQAVASRAESLLATAEY